MSLADLAFLVGPVGAVIVVPVAVGVMLTRRYHRDWAAMFLLLLCPVLGAAWLGYWILWVKISQYMNRYEPVPPAVERAADVCLVVCAAAVTALAVAMMTAVSDSRHERRTAMSE